MKDISLVFKIIVDFVRGKKLIAIVFITAALLFGVSFLSVLGGFRAGQGRFSAVPCEKQSQIPVRRSKAARGDRAGAGQRSGSDPGGRESCMNQFNVFSRDTNRWTYTEKY